MLPGEIARKYFPPEKYESRRKCINNFKNRRQEVLDQYAAEQAEARAQAASEVKREAGKELAAIKRHKSHIERNEEERDLIIQAAKACMFDAEGELLPSDQQDRANFARCMTVAAQLTAQIKPLTPTEGDKTPQESGFLKGYMAKAEAFYGNKQTGVSVGSAKPESRTDPVLVDSSKPR